MRSWIERIDFAKSGATEITETLSGSGSCTFSIVSVIKSFLIGLVASREAVELIVSDTGQGVSRDVKERLFLPYFSTKQRGTGLGLAIVSRIVEDHHGSIRVEENKPVGSRFVVELPVAVETISAPAAS